MVAACTSSRATPPPSAEGLEVGLLRYHNTISGPQDIQTVVTDDTDFGAAFNGAIVNRLEVETANRAGRELESRQLRRRLL